MGQMTTEQLKTFIKETSLPLIKQCCEQGGDVANTVQQAVEAALAKQQTAPSWASQLFSGAEPKAVAPERPQGYGFARIARAYAAAKIQHGSASAETAMKVLKGWGDTDLVESMEKAMSATSAQGGGFLVPTQFSTDVIEFLRARTVVRRTNGGPRTIPMPNGTIKVPKISSGTTAAYVGEVANATKTEAQTGQLTLTFKKLAAIVPFSNDLLRYSSPQADAVVRDDLVRAIMVKEDATFLRSNGAAGTPTGYRYLAPAANIIAANSSVSLANAITDLGKLIVQLLNANVPMTRPAWYMAPRTWNWLMTIQNSNGFYVFREEMMNGTLWGWPYGYSTSVPINLTDQGGTTESEITLVDLDDAVIGEAANLVIDVSNEAAYYDGANVISAFSQDTTVIRAIEEHDFAMRRPESVAVLNGVTWT